MTKYIKLYPQNTYKIWTYTIVLPKYSVCPFCGNKSLGIEKYKKRTLMDLQNFNEFNLILVNSTRYYCKRCKGKIPQADSRIPKDYGYTFAVIKKIFEYFQDCHNLSTTASLISKNTGLKMDYATIGRIIDHFRNDNDYLEYIKNPFDLKTYSIDNGIETNNIPQIQFKTEKKEYITEEEPDVIVEAIDSIHSGKNGIQNDGKHCFTMIYDSKKKKIIALAKTDGENEEQIKIFLNNRIKYLTKDKLDNYYICSDEGRGICAGIDKTVGNARRITCQSLVGFHINKSISEEWSNFFHQFINKSQNNFTFICNQLNIMKLTKLITNNNKIIIPLKNRPGQSPFLKFILLFNNIERNTDSTCYENNIYDFLIILHKAHEPEIAFIRKCLHVTLQKENFYSLNQIIDRFEFYSFSDNKLNIIHRLIRETLLKYYKEQVKGHQFIKKYYNQLIKACSLNYNSKSRNARKSIDKLLQPWYKKASGFTGTYKLTQNIYKLKDISDPIIYSNQINAWHCCKMRPGFRTIIDYHLNNLPYLTRYSTLSIKYHFDFQKWKRLRVVPEWINRKIRNILFNGAGFHGMKQLTRNLISLYPNIFILEFLPNTADFKIWHLPN
jgi:hypothetical protein